MKFVRPALLSLACPFLASVQADWTVGQAVDTTSGIVNGHAAPLDASVSEYLGIPWGAAPVGALRFMPPQPVAKSAKPIAADRFGPDCPQAGVGAAPAKAAGSGSGAAGASLTNSFSGSGRFGEDCLTLNVWTKPQTGEGKKAVLVWIYGGGFTSGSTTSPSTSGVQFAAKQDVVLVSIKWEKSSSIGTRHGLIRYAVTVSILWGSLLRRVSQISISV
jgi:cholinesterase